MAPKATEGAGQRRSGADRLEAVPRARLAEERARFEALGATYRREATGMAGEIWIEMLDPEGNWFCVQ